MDSKRDFPIEIKNPGRAMTYTYVISLSVIAVLSIIVHFMLDQVIAQQNDTGKIVNVSGQQRMLSQRTSLFAIEYLTLGSPEAKQLAQQALQTMHDNHDFLLAEHYAAASANEKSPLSDALFKMYFEEPQNVDQKLKQFSSQIEQALSLDGTARQEYAEMIKSGFLAMARKPLLQSLHAVVEQYEKESIEKVNELRFAQDVVLGIIIFTIFVEAMFIFRPMVSRISKFAFRLQQEANFDHLTGLLNRRSFKLLADKAVAASRRYGRPLCVVMIDIDFFKKINDGHGHAVGDVAIEHVANTLQKSCRSADCVARFGGEEFVLLLPDTDKSGALRVAEKIRMQVESDTLTVNGIEVPITISAGVAELGDDHLDIEAPLMLADHALYDAKNTGRNKVMASDMGPLPSSP